MPAEPEPSPVEAMLRDAARRGRDAFDAAGPGAATMPGPMRTRLHEELARRFDAPARGAAASSGGGLARWWLAFAGAAGAAAVVALFVVASQKVPERPAAVAVSSAPAAPRGIAPLPVLAPVLPTPATPAPAPEPPAEAARGAVATRRDQPFADARADSTFSKAKDATPPGNAMTRTAGVSRAQTFTQIPVPLAASPSRNAVLARQAASAPGASAGGGTAGPPAAAARPSPPSLLENFRFEQRGENVRVVDADGSVYVGQVEADKAPTQAQGTLRANPATPADAVAQSQDASAGADNFRFRATGNNRTLRKPVVFEGEYTSPLPDAANGTKPEAKAANAQPPATPEAQIRGRVRVLGSGRDGQRAAEVDARAVEAAGSK